MSFFNSEDFSRWDFSCRILTNLFSLDHLVKMKRNCLITRERINYLHDAESVNDLKICLSCESFEQNGGENFIYDGKYTRLIFTRDFFLRFP